MKNACCLFLLTLVLLSACAPVAPASTITPTPTLTPFNPSTPLPSDTPTLTSTLTETPTYTPIPPSATATLFTDTPSPTAENTEPPTGEFPGVQVHGQVSTPTGEAVPGVQIYFALSAGPGESLLATTDSQGYYEGFISIPHQEVVRVWAEFAGYTFKPGKADRAWSNGEFGWIYWGGYENVALDFIGTVN